MRENQVKREEPRCIPAPIHEGVGTARPQFFAQHRPKRGRAVPAPLRKRLHELALAASSEIQRDRRPTTDRPRWIPKIYFTARQWYAFDMPKTNSDHELLFQRRSLAAKLKPLGQALAKYENDPGQLRVVRELHSEIAALSATFPASAAGLGPVTIKAVAELLNDCLALSTSLSPSASRTLLHLLPEIERMILEAPQVCDQPVTRFRILAVDDDEAVLDMMTQSLLTVPVNVEPAKDSSAALRFAELHPWDLFILDISMPDMDAFDLCDKIRQLPAHRKTPVLFLTGFDNFYHRKRFAQTRANDFISKPVTPAELVVKAIGLLLETQLAMAFEERVDANLFRPIG